MSYIYIAAPFFNEKQLNFVMEVENALTKSAISFYSPRKAGILQDLSEEERQVAKSAIYKDNIDNIDNCKIVIAVIDDRDTGTIWEMGYATASGKRVISISNEGYGLNVMLAESVQAHTNSIDEMIKAVFYPEYRGRIVEGIF